MIGPTAYPGLIVGQQQPVRRALPYWKYGNIKNGKKIIDPLLHWGCFILGFTDTDIIDHVADYLKNIKPELAEEPYGSTNPLRLNDASFRLAERLYHISGGYKVFFSLSGSDANEGALKLAAAYHHHKSNTHKKITVGFEKSYHGSTWLTSALGHVVMGDPYYGMDRPAHVRILPREFDLQCLDWNEVSAIMIETCSYGRETIPETPEFWQKLTYIQEHYDVLLIIDDIFVGGGKTNTFIGWQGLPVQPDIFTMGKSITAGYFPLSATFYNNRVSETLVGDFCWNHGFTYSFHQAGIMSCLRYLDILEEKKYLENHDVLVSNTQEIFHRNGVTVYGQFGRIFYVQIKKVFYPSLYVIPVNADDEYFSVLHDNTR